jgi:DNA-binding SARP family transcriptional activator
MGELRVIHAGRTLSPPPPRAHALLAALLLRPEAQRRERLASLLSPDLGERAARRRLSDRLWVLRDTLPRLPLEASSERLKIPVEQRWLDVEAFRQLAKSDDLADWRAALALYSGDLLPGCFDDWLLVDREGIHLNYVRLLHRSAEQLFRLQRVAEALPLARELMREESLDERALRLLMRCHEALGQRGAALAAYERFVATAADQLGIDPTPATRALAKAVRASAPSPRPCLPLPGDAHPNARLHRARAALDRGDRATAEGCLDALRSSGAAGDTGLKVLEVDLALLCEDDDEAARILRTCDGDDAALMARRAAVALHRRELQSAHEAARRALLLAHDEKREDKSLEALLVLAQTQRRLGHTAQSMATAEQALKLASSLDYPAGIVRASLTQGMTLFRQGRTRDAIPFFHRAQSLAHEHGLRRHLAEALQGLANARSDLGIFLDVLPEIKQALSIWRDLGIRRSEASALQTRASILDLLGRHGEAARDVERAKQIYDALDDPFGAARCQYHMAAGMPFRDEELLDEAIALAEEAIATFRAYDETAWEASALSTLGYLLLLDEAYEAALEPLQEAYKKHDRLGEVGFLPDLLAHLALSHLGLGQLTQATDCTSRALLTLAQGVLDNDVASEVYYAHAMVLDAHGQHEQAQEYLIRAYENLLKHAEQLEDEAARRAFFSRGPMVRRLMEEVYARDIAPNPRSGVVTRWLPYRAAGSHTSDGRDLVAVTWTLDAGPPDVALKRSRGAIALRRSRVERMLTEAQAQGARPTVKHLANVLGVSPRTIKRDLAALRDAGRIS